MEINTVCCFGEVAKSASLQGQTRTMFRSDLEHGPGVVKTLHRDHLLPIGYMVWMSNLSDDKEPVRRPVTRAQLT